LGIVGFTDGFLKAILLFFECVSDVVRLRPLRWMLPDKTLLAEGRREQPRRLKDAFPILYLLIRQARRSLQEYFPLVFAAQKYLWPTAEIILGDITNVWYAR
jgi:hypothetical protein